jgi:hypothetical protein
VVQAGLHIWSVWNMALGFGQAYLLKALEEVQVVLLDVSSGDIIGNHRCRLHRHTRHAYSHDIFRDAVKRSVGL